MSKKGIILIAVSLIFIAVIGLVWQTSIHSNTVISADTNIQPLPVQMLSHSSEQPTVLPTQSNVAAPDFTPNINTAYSGLVSSNSNATPNSYINISNLNLDTSGINSYSSWAKSQPNSNSQTLYNQAMNINADKVITSGNVTNIPVGAVWQLDPNQYANLDQYKLWSGSTCSVASLVSVLTAYGHKVSISQVLSIMLTRGGISPEAGLSNYGNFDYVAQLFGLHATVDENPNLDQHFNSILTQLQSNQLVIVNVQDSTYFPNGHFMVAYHLNTDGTVAIMNPYAAPGQSVFQNWPLTTLKLFFSRTSRSVTFMRQQ